jgi:hypothetical protein
MGIAKKTYVKPEPKRSEVSNEYTPHLQDLITETDAFIAGGGKYNETGQPAFTVDEIDAQKWDNEIFKVQSAARALHKTARIVNKVTDFTIAGKDADGNDVLSGTGQFDVIVTPPQKGRRGVVVAQPEADPADAK